MYSRIRVAPFQRESPVHSVPFRHKHCESSLRMESKKYTENLAGSQIVGLQGCGIYLGPGYLELVKVSLGLSCCLNDEERIREDAILRVYALRSLVLNLF